MKEIFQFILGAFAFYGIIYGLGFCFKAGWNLADSKTKRVCDLCFRDIKRVNDYLKEMESRNPEKAESSAKKPA